MARAIWSGAISFGLVNVPVQMYSAIAEHKLHFRLVHEPDQSPIGYQKVCKLEDKPVPDDEVVKAFEFEPGEYVLMEDEDFEAARVEGYKTIEIADFVPHEQIDPIYFARTYYLGPADGGEQVYGLLLRAMERSGLAGVAKFVMRDRQNLGALRVRDGVIILEQMYFADEIRPLDEIKPRKAAVSNEELAMADGNGRAHGKRASGNGSRDDLSGLSKSQLDERARQARIPGRSKMSKHELVEALSEAG